MARIFIVEDNESIREAVAGYLRLEEHEVIEFGGVADVLEVMRHKAPDLAILDVMLPDGSGFALAKKIRAESKVPLVFLTAREAESDRITGFELGRGRLRGEALLAQGAGAARAGAAAPLGCGGRPAGGRRLLGARRVAAVPRRGRPPGPARAPRSST